MLTYQEHIIEMRLDWIDRPEIERRKKRSHRKGPRINKVAFYKTIFLVVGFYRKTRWRLDGVHKPVLKEIEVHVEVGRS